MGLLIMDWLGKLKEYAPSIASAVLTGGTTLPQLAFKAIKDATGIDMKSETDLKSFVESANPEQLIAMKRANHDYDIKKAELKVELRKVESEELETVNKTIRVESSSDDWFVRRWRPFYGYCVAVSWAIQMIGFTGVLLYTAVKNPTLLSALVSQMAVLLGSLITLWGIALAVLGVSIHKRSQDKQKAPKENGGLIKSLLSK